MASNLDRFKADIKSLVTRGESLNFAIRWAASKNEFETEVERQLGDKSGEFLKALPPAASTYEVWYSESKSLLRQVLPDRLSDFVRLHEKPRARKAIEYGNYVMEDFLQGLLVTRNGSQKVGPSAAISQFEQMLNIVKAAERRFESSLFDMRQLAQADLFDSELEAARGLLKAGFSRAAGAVSGVVLEKHLLEVSRSHELTLKKNPTISNLNDALKEAGVIDVPRWRNNTLLADLRNLCDHAKSAEPTVQDIEDLISGVDRAIKTIF